MATISTWRQHPARTPLSINHPAATLDARLESIRSGYEEYRSTHAADWNWVRDTIRHYASTGKLPEGTIDR